MLLVDAHVEAAQNVTWSQQDEESEERRDENGSYRVFLLRGASSLPMRFKSVSRRGDPRGQGLRKC
eukprot:9475172-Pyramimonas_sp.AAC.1